MYRKPWLEDLARRRVGSPEEAAARARRGAALARAVLAGKAAAPEPVAAQEEPTHGQYQAVACTRCHGPHDGPPGTRCPKCQQSDQGDGWPDVAVPGG